MLLTEIDHVAIAVRDLEAAIEYYQKAFGATVDHREIVESDGVEEALLKVAESYVQLLTPRVLHLSIRHHVLVHVEQLLPSFIPREVSAPSSNSFKSKSVRHGRMDKFTNRR